MRQVPAIISLRMDIISKKTKVMFVITKSNFGGAQKYVYDLATNISKDQFEVAVVVGGSGVLIQKLNEQSVRVLPILALARDINIVSDIRAFFELWSLFRNERPDVVHLNSAKAGGMGALAARFARVPQILFTAHGWAFNEERPVFQRLIIKFFSWITMLLSHETIAVSEAMKRDAENFLFVGKKIIVIKNGIKRPEFYTREDARAKISQRVSTPVPQDAFIICTIAELHRSKGLQYSIDAFAKLIPTNPTLYYFIFGDGEEKEHLNTLIKFRGLQGNVFLLGFINDASRLLLASDTFILPSITEAFGLVLLEAGFAGLPVVASRVGGIPEIIDDGKTGLLVPARDVDGLASALQSLSSDKKESNLLGHALLQKTELYFSLSRVIKETSTLYTKK